MGCSKVICVNHCNLKEALCEISKLPQGTLKIHPGTYQFPSGTLCSADRVILRGQIRFEPRDPIGIEAFQADSKTILTGLQDPLEFIRLEEAGILPVFVDVFTHTPYVSVAGAEIPVETGSPLVTLKINGDLEIFQDLVLEQVRLEVSGKLKLSGNLTVRESIVVVGEFEQVSGRINLERSKLLVEQAYFSAQQDFRISYIKSPTPLRFNLAHLDWIQTVIADTRVELNLSQFDFDKSCGPDLLFENVQFRIGSGLVGKISGHISSGIFTGFDGFGNFCFDTLNINNSHFTIAETSLGSSENANGIVDTISLVNTDVWAAGGQWNFFSSGPNGIRIHMIGGSFKGNIELIDVNAAQPGSYNWELSGGAIVYLTPTSVAQFTNTSIDRILFSTSGFNFPYPPVNTPLVNPNDLSSFLLVNTL